MKSKTIIFIIVGIILISIIFGYTYKTNMANNNQDKNTALLKTNFGDIEILLYDDMPITTENFKSLIEKDTYNGVIFHRIIPGFMIQGGDPTGTGMGDSSISNIQDEFTHAGGNKNTRGTISMANAGPNTGSSQFFINLVDNNFLDDKHPAFGNVVNGMETIDKIANTPTSQEDKPLKDVVIESAELV
jgi:peptidylprolyl isomerase